MLPMYLLSHLLLCLHTGERVLASGSVQLPRFTLLESGSLLISPSHISDAGTYTCMASNSRGIDEASADLVVWGECAGLDGFHILLKKHTCLRYVVNARAILPRRWEMRLRHIMVKQIQKHSCVQLWSHHRGVFCKKPSRNKIQSSSMSFQLK